MCSHQVHEPLNCVSVCYYMYAMAAFHSREVVASFYCLILFTLIVELLKTASSRVTTHVCNIVCIHGNV